MSLLRTDVFHVNKVILNKTDNTVGLSLLSSSVKIINILFIGHSLHCLTKYVAKILFGNHFSLSKGDDT